MGTLKWTAQALIETDVLARLSPFLNRWSTHRGILRTLGCDRQAEASVEVLCTTDCTEYVYSCHAFAVVESSAVPSHCEGVNGKLDRSGTFRACRIAMRRCDLVSEAVDDLYTYAGIDCSFVALGLLESG